MRHPTLRSRHPFALLGLLLVGGVLMQLAQPSPARAVTAPVGTSIPTGTASRTATPTVLRTAPRTPLGTVTATGTTAAVATTTLPAPTATPHSRSAGSPVETGALTLAATFESVSVYAAFAGDADGD